MADTELQILIAADALARGKNIPDVDIVVIHDLPQEKDPSVCLQMFGLGFINNWEGAHCAYTTLHGFYRTSRQY
jgi:Helicase conserved C-terminal domain